MEAESVIWTDKAKLQLEEIYLFIVGQSLIQADKVFVKIVDSTKALLHQPLRYPPDPYKLLNNGEYRAYEIFSYRISYRVFNKRGYILRIRGVAQNPKLY